jgi:hypothetical protein
MQSYRKKNKKFCEELIAYFPWYDTGHIENDASNNSSIAAVTFLPSRCVATIGGDTHTHRQQRDLISLLLFFRNKKSGLKRLRRPYFEEKSFLRASYTYLLKGPDYNLEWVHRVGPLQFQFNSGPSYMIMQFYSIFSKNGENLMNEIFRCTFLFLAGIFSRLSAARG